MLTKIVCMIASSICGPSNKGRGLLSRSPKIAHKPCQRCSCTLKRQQSSQQSCPMCKLASDSSPGLPLMASHNHQGILTPLHGLTHFSCGKSDNVIQQPFFLPTSFSRSTNVTRTSLLSFVCTVTGMITLPRSVVVDGHMSKLPAPMSSPKLF